MNIFLDMDGVLVDFDKSADLIVPNRGSLKSSLELSFEEKKNRKLFYNKIQTEYPNFWLDLSPMLDIEVLINFLGENKKDHKINVISKVPNLSSDYKELVKGHKIQWVKKYFPNVFDDILIIDDNKQKYMVGEPNDNILIDDRKLNIMEWVNFGGVGIIFESPKQALQELKTTRAFNEL